MKKREAYFKVISVFQIFLMISFVFAFSFIIGEIEFVSGSSHGFCYNIYGERVDLKLGSGCKLPFLYDAPPEIVKEAPTTKPLSNAPNPTNNGGATKEPLSSSGAGAASSTVAGLGIFDAILGGSIKDPSGATSSTTFKNFNTKFTEPMRTAFEAKGASNFEVVDGTLKSFVQDGQLHTIDTVTGAITSSKVTTFDIPFFGTVSGLPAHLIQGALWAAGVVAAIQLFGPFLGLEDETTNALSTAAAVGIMTSSLAAGLVESYAETFSFFGDKVLGLTYGAWAGIGVAVVVFLLLYEKQEEKIVSFSCLPWQAPTGGDNCEVCNKQGILPCSEYQCKSLGQSCELINKGTNEESCVWVNRQDVNPPTIEPWENALLNDYSYLPDNAINPPDRGVKINYLKSQDRCIPAFTPLRFGVELNEPAKCKVDVLRKENFESMSSFMSGGLSRYNHSYALSLPGKSALELENITLRNDGNYELFVRCQDSNGNSNVATFVFKYCVDPGADTTPPLIVTTSILNNVPVAFNQSSIDLEVYVNEPSECKWSRDDRDFNSMEQTMSCSSNIFEFNAQVLYKCSTTLTGIKDRVENKFYFRCLDQPNAPASDRNVNVESYEFTLIGTQPLVIDSVKPNDTTVSDSTDAVKVTIEARTSSGFNEGESICYYSDTGNENDFIKFFETGSFEHSQDLFLTGGSYEYFIRCIDLGGNSDSKTINFDVETDLSSPLVVRAYKEENFLKLITDENAECVYSTFGCNYAFDEGTQITVVNGTNQFISWSTESSLYVKCKDDFGNRPLPNQCSITVRPSDF